MAESTAAHAGCHSSQDGHQNFRPQISSKYPEIPNDPVFYYMFFLIINLKMKIRHRWFNQGQPSKHYNLPIWPSESKWHGASPQEVQQQKKAMPCCFMGSSWFFHVISGIFCTYILSTFQCCPLWGFRHVPWGFMAGAEKNTRRLHAFKEFFRILWPGLWLSHHPLGLTD